MIVSGYDDFAYCREALKLQITDYLLKPVDYEEFGACIDHLRIALFEKGAARADASGEGEKTIWSLTRYLQEHLSEEISLNLLADVFHLNPQYIGQLFKNEIGVNFLSCLTNIRMERAKKLLVSTDLPARWRRGRGTRTTVCLQRPSKRLRACPRASTGRISSLAF